MSRRPTPVLVKTGDSGAIPTAVDGEEARGISLAEPNATRNTKPAPPPLRKREPTVLWICDPPATAPHGATACTPEQASAWARGPMPDWLVKRRVDGVIVQCDPAAPAAVRRAARALRDRVTPHEPAGLRELAAVWGNAAIISATDRIDLRSTPTFADLARALARGEDPESAHLARLCWALEHL